MYKACLILIAFVVVLSTATPAQTLPAAVADERPHANEKLAIQALRQIRSAQFTYGATTGNGDYGSLFDLHHADLIDAALARGEKHGYVFNLSVMLRTINTPARFYLTAIPREYLKTGRRSFYLTIEGEFHAADKKGRFADASDPTFDVCSSGTIAENERCIFNPLRTLHSAEMAYAATYGNGNYGSLSQLRSARLIPKNFETKPIHGYAINVVIFTGTSTTPALFKISAVPHKYGVTGVRSFFIGSDGVFRGADKNGKPADEADPYALPCSPCSSAENEPAIISALRTLQGAETTYTAAMGDGSYGSLQQLNKAKLIEQNLSSGLVYGYKLTITVVALSSRHQAGFKISAVPEVYGTSGVSSFFVDESGVIRGADKNGSPADENDTPIDQ